MTSMQNTQIKLLASALELRRQDIAEIITMGGVNISNNRVDSWMRSKNSTKNATGNSSMAGERVRRAATITPDEFHAFCVGLKPWLEKQDLKE